MECQRRNIILQTNPLASPVNHEPKRILTIFCRVLLSLALMGTALAQTANERSPVNADAGSASSNVEIIKLEWKREVRLPRNFDPAVIPTGGTFNDPATRTAGGPTPSTDANRASAARSGADSSSGTFPATPSRLPVF